METIEVIKTIGIMLSIILSCLGIGAYITKVINRQFERQIGSARRRARENRLIFETMILLIKAVRGDQVNGELTKVEVRINDYLYGLIDDCEEEDKNK